MQPIMIMPVFPFNIAKTNQYFIFIFARVTMLTQ